MGYAGSKMDKDEGVVQCKARRHAIRQSVASRHAFAAAHAAYVQALKNIGAAFKQFAETELWEELGTVEDPTPLSKEAIRPPPLPAFFPQPPPLTDYIKRTTSLPPFLLDKQSNKAKPLTLPSPADGKENEKYSYGGVPRPPPPPPKDYIPFSVGSPMDVSQAWHSKQVLETLDEQSESGYSQEDVSASEFHSAKNYADHGKKQKRIKFLQALQEVDDLFMQAYQSGKAIALILEARKVHYHSNFVDPKGFNDHSMKVMTAISWGYWSNNRTPIAPGHETAHENGGQGKHAATLDWLFAWERKLHDEVKVAKIIKIEYEKKCNLLRRQESKKESIEAIEKARAAVKSLQTHLTVALHAVDTASSAIQKLRDEELYFQLLELLEGYTDMWQVIYDCHRIQINKVLELKPVDSLRELDATPDAHILATQQLETCLNAWYSTCNKVIVSQKEFIQHLNGWIRLNLVPLGTESKDLGTPGEVSTPLVAKLCQEWKQSFEQLPSEVALDEIKSLASFVHKIVELHEKEVQEQKTVETLAKDLRRKEDALQIQRKPTHEEFEIHENVDGGLVQRDPLSEKTSIVDPHTKRLEEAKAKLANTIQDSWTMTVKTFARLPSVFQAVTGYADHCRRTFQKLQNQIKSETLLM